MDYQAIAKLADKVRQNVSRVIIGKEDQFNLIFAAIIAGGHVLLEDVPGTGKTVMARSIAASMRCGFSRLQFTPDLLPADITGMSVFKPSDGTFQFVPGPVFTHILLADEINRATPRTQSALLECMEEKQVTEGGVTRTLERPFLVIATQNPVETQGTFPLPEAQLDRFLIQLSMGYTDKAESVRILEKFVNEVPAANLESVCTREQLLDMQDSIRQVTIHPDLAAYSVDIVEKTRQAETVQLGVSPRGNLALLKAAQALAAIRGRDFVTPDDIKTLAEPVLGHRILLRGSSRNRSTQISDLIAGILEEVEVPTENFRR